MNCGKLGHKTAARALAYQDKKWPGTYRRAYRCDRCGLWHISTTPIGQTIVGRKAVRL